MIQSPDEDEAKVRQALEQISVHVRLREQGLEADGPELDTLRRIIGRLIPFGTNHYLEVHAVLDWDHLIPSAYGIVRIYAAYSQHEARLLETQMRARDQAIEADNVYPEFDLPDYAEMEASETYVGVWQPGAEKLEDFRFFASWRKDVKPAVARQAVAAVRGMESYKKAYRERDNDALGSAVVVGWAPPVLAEAENWAVEVWLVTDFDGQSGKAMVFMVDHEKLEITREYMTEVHVA